MQDTQRRASSKDPKQEPPNDQVQARAAWRSLPQEQCLAARLGAWFGGRQAISHIEHGADFCLSAELLAPRLRGQLRQRSEVVGVRVLT
jgi:hypothetical protein